MPEHPHLPSPPSTPPPPVYVYCNFRHSPLITLSPFILRSLERLPANNSPLFAPRDRISRTISITVGVSSPILPSSESPDIEFLRAGACSGTIMNKASSRRRLRLRRATMTTTTSREKCIFVVRRLVRYFLRDFPFISRLAHSRERYCPRRFPLIFHAHAVKMEIHFNALFTARVPFYVRANNSDDQFALACRIEQIGFEIKNFWSKIS